MSGWKRGAVLSRYLNPNAPKGTEIRYLTPTGTESALAHEARWFDSDADAEQGRQTYGMHWDVNGAELSPEGDVCPW